MPDENAEDPLDKQLEEEIQEALGGLSPPSVQDVMTITRLIIQIRDGNEAAKAENELFGLVMDDLRRKAESALRRFSGLKGAPEADQLINESWPTLHRALASHPLRNRSHFFAFAFKKFIWLLLTASEAHSDMPLLEIEEVEDLPLKRIRHEQIFRACLSLSGDEELVFAVRHLGIEYLEEDKPISDMTPDELISGLLPSDLPVFRRIAAVLGFSTANEAWRIYRSALKTIKSTLGTDPRDK